ncbi:MAG: substrate-binding domain-containing protein [Lachnospiraceae bacterium]|nr:substrate-binding domain-containing protein [Lachnospiraceae bacterium]
MIGNYKVIAVCISKVHDTSCFEFVTKLNQKINGENYRLFIYNLCNDLSWSEDKQNIEAAVFDLIDYSITDAVVIMNEKIRNKEVTQEIIKKSVAHNVPAFVVDGEYEECINLNFDYNQGFENVVRHVVESHSVKNVHFMSGDLGNPFAERRLEVFKKVIAQNGIIFDESMVSYGNFAADHTAKATEKIIASGNIPEAIICANDVMAISVVSVLKQHGISVPHQVIVTGFDGIDEIFYLSPQITSCFCDYDDMATTVFESIKKKLDGEEVSNIVNVTPKLILSESCGCNTDAKEFEPDFLKIVTTSFFRAQDENRIIFEMVESMQNAPNKKAATACLDKREFNNMCCVINNSCTDRSINLVSMDIPDKYEDEMYLLYDGIAGDKFSQGEFKRSEIVPNLEDKLKLGEPLIFNELDFMGKTLGYACFQYREPDVVQYSKISLIVTALRNAVGGFVNVQYQHYISEKMGELYKIDPQTKLYNRFGFDLEYKALEAKLKNEGGKLTVIFARLDNLDSITEEYGYAAGDDAIETAAEIFKEACPDYAICVHFGGSDMMAVIEGESGTDDIVNKIKASIGDFNSDSEVPVDLQMPVGVYVADAANEDIDFETLAKNTRKVIK